MKDRHQLGFGWVKFLFCFRCEAPLIASHTGRISVQRWKRSVLLCSGRGSFFFKKKLPLNLIVIWRYIECWSSEVRVTFCHCIWSRKMTLTVTGEKLWGGSSFIFTILICCTGLSTLCPILMMKRFWKEQEDSYFVDQLVSAPSSETLFSRLLCMLHRSNSLPYILICVRYVTYCLCFHEIGNCFSPLAAVREDENQLCHGIQTISGIGIQSRLQLIFEFLIAFLLSPFPKDTWTCL